MRATNRELWQSSSLFAYFGSQSTLSTERRNNLRLHEMGGATDQLQAFFDDVGAEFLAWKLDNTLCDDVNYVVAILRHLLQDILHYIVAWQKQEQQNTHMSATDTLSPPGPALTHKHAHTNLWCLSVNMNGRYQSSPHPPGTLCRFSEKKSFYR